MEHHETRPSEHGKGHGERVVTMLDVNRQAVGEVLEMGKQDRHETGHVEECGPVRPVPDDAVSQGNGSYDNGDQHEAQIYPDASEEAKT